MRSSIRARSRAGIFLLSLLFAPAARAQSASPAALAAAQPLFEQAEKALDRKDYASACPKLEEVVRLVPEGLGAKLSLGECYEGSGKLASAWSMYVLVADAATRARQPARQRLAEQRAAALRPRLAELTIVVSPAAQALAGIAVERDQVAVGAPQWGLPVPVDRGDHLITAAATGKRPWKKVVSVGADGARITVEIDALEAETPAPAPPAPAPVPPAPPPVIPPAAPAPAITSAAPPPPPRRPPFWDGARIGGAALAGAGVIALGVGVGLGVRALSRNADSNAAGHCHDGNVCDAVGFPLREDARTSGSVSTAFFITGGAAVAAGLTFFLVAPRAVRAEVVAAPNGALVRGRW